MTVKEIKNLMEQYKKEAEEKIPELKSYIVDGDGNYHSEELGFAKGYAKALEEILAKIQTKRGTALCS
jgi:hypothetical protein